MAALGVGAFYFYFSLKIDVMPSCPTCLSVVLFPCDCLSWVEETTLVLWLLNGCRGIRRTDDSVVILHCDRSVSIVIRVHYIDQKNFSQEQY